MVGLENETVVLNSDKKIDLEAEIRNQLSSLQVEYATIIEGDGSPSYMVIENVYGMNISGVIGSCAKIDTLISEKIILPEFIQIGMNCK